MTDAFHDPPIDPATPPSSTPSPPGSADPRDARGAPGSGGAWVHPAEEEVVRPGWLGPLAAFAAGFVITALAAWLVIRFTHRAGVEACRAEASRCLSRAKLEFQSAVDGVNALAAFLALGEPPNPTQFDAFAASIISQSPALVGLAWEPFVDSSNLPAVEAIMRRRTGEETSIWCPPPPGGDGRRTRPPPQRIHAPLAYVHPAEPFMAVHGLDILSPTVRYPFQDTLLRAEPTVWGPLALPWVAGSPRAVFVTSPIVAGPVAASGAAAGFILVDPILARASGFPSHPHMRIEIVTPPSQARSFPGFAGSSTSAGAPVSTRARRGSSLVHEETVNIGGQKLTLRAVGDPTYFMAGRDQWVWVVLAVGSFFSLLGASFVGTRGRVARRIRAQRLELERVNSSLRESEERFRLALQAVDGIVYDWNAVENRAIRSGGLLAGLGYVRELPSTLEAWLEIIHPEDRAGALAHFQRAADAGDALSIEYRIRHADGHYVEVWDRGVVIRGPEGQTRRIVGCTISLAEQRRAERAVREANARFAQFADAINDVLWTVELNPRRVVYINPAFERVWGIPRELVYQDPDSWMEAVIPEDRARVKEATRAWEVSDSKAARQIEYRIRRSDGEVRWIQDTSVRIDEPAGKVARVVGIAKDITSRKRIQLDLEESEEAYRQLFDSNLAVKLIFDPADGAIVQVNKAAAEFYGYPKPRFQAMNIRDLCATNSYDQWREKHQDDLGAIRLESAHKLADGEVKEVEIFATSIQRKGRTLKYLLIHDISERKRVERDLEASRRTLEQAQAVGRIGSWVSDATPEGRLLWSSQVFRIFGLPPDEFDQRISTFFRLVHPEDLEQVKVATAEAIRTGSVYRIDHRIVRPDGEIRWVLEQGELECDAEGAPVRIVGVVQDITERHDAEQALRDSQERLRTTLDSLAEGCLVLDASGAFVDCNRPAERILGVSREALLSRNIGYSTGWQVFSEDGTALRAEEYPASVSLRTGQSVDGRVVGMISPSGAALWISMNSRPLYDAQGVIRGAVVSFADIAERRAASIALQQTAKRYQLLFDANPEPLWVYDAKSLRFLAVNQAAVESYGYSKEEFLSLTILDIRPREERTRLEEHLLTIGADSPRLRATWVHQLKSGALIDVEVISHPVTFEGREARIVLAKDITERVRAERALRHSEARLREAQRIGSFGDWEYDIATDGITWSDEVYRLFHRDPAQGPPVTFEENLRYYAPQDSERLAAAVRDAIDHARDSQVDLQVVLPDGSRLWHRAIIRVVTDEQGRVIRLKGIVQDITQRKLAEEALRATQLRLATILEHLPDVVVYESDGRHIFPSDNMVSLIGYPAETFSHDRAAFTRLVHPADLQIAERRISQLRAARDTEALVLQYRLRHRAGHYVWIEDRMVYEYDSHGGDRLLGVLIDITERKRSEQRQRLMMSELDHRVKNNLATVISLLEQTGRTAKSQIDFHQTFLGRLQALARMHKALSRTHWEGVGLRSLVSQTLEAYQSDPPGRVQISGEDLTLPARAASPLAMALHELATNAVKYGALSVPHGSVRVEWTLADSEGVPHLSLLWAESGGPPVTPPDEAGFGSELIQGGIAYELHGEARIEFDPGGVRCYMNIPLHAHPPVLPSLLDSV